MLRSSILLSFPSHHRILVMDPNLKNNDLDENNVRIKTSKIVTKGGENKRPNKCNQCEYASSEAGNLRRHLRTHSGEKSNKCNQCNYASSDASNLRNHLKTHSGEKSNKCNQCDFASSQASNLRAHLKTHSGETVSYTHMTLPTKA